MLNQTTMRSAAALVVLIACACTRSKNADDPNRYAYSKIAPPGEPTAIGGGPSTVPVEVATDDIAAAQCDREQRCDNIGTGRKYVDRSDCLSRLAKEIVDALDSTNCPNGINSASLSECESDARDESCSAAGVGRLCSAANVCGPSSGHF